MAREREQADEEIWEDDAEGQGGEGEGGSEGARSSEGAADDSGQEQEAGFGEDVEDFFDAPPARKETTQQRLEREIAELRRERAQPIQPASPAPRSNLPPILQETEDQFQARLQLLPPDERMEARMVRAEAKRDLQLQQMQFQQQEQADRVAFDAKCSVDGRYRRWQERVEKKHSELMQQGTPAPREVILKFLLGEHVLSQAGGQEARKGNQARKQRVAKQTVRPGNAGSDVAADRRGRVDERTARARRLENVQI